MATTHRSNGVVSKEASKATSNGSKADFSVFSIARTRILNASSAKEEGI